MQDEDRTLHRSAVNMDPPNSRFPTASYVSGAVVRPPFDPTTTLNGSYLLVQVHYLHSALPALISCTCLLPVYGEYAQCCKILAWTLRQIWTLTQSNPCTIRRAANGNAPSAFLLGILLHRHGKLRDGGKCGLTNCPSIKNAVVPFQERCCSAPRV
jgi:hypothetical protein